MTAEIGHNSGAVPPAYDPEKLDEAKALVGRAQEAAAKWQATPVHEEHTAGKLNDFLTGLRAAAKKVDEARAAAKAPHDAAGKAVQAAFTPLLDALEKMQNAAKAKLTEFATAERERQRAAAEVQRKAAEAERQRAAEEAAKAALRGDLMAEAEAQAAVKVAEKAAKAADKATFNPMRIGTATGAGRTAALRTTWEPEVKNIRVALLHFSERPEVLDLILRLAAAEMGAAPVKAEVTIPGIVFHKRQSVA